MCLTNIEIPDCIKTTIALDYLKITSIRRNKEELVSCSNETIQIVSLNYGLDVFSETYTVYWEGVRLGMLQAKPRMKNLHECLVAFTCDNAFLYTNFWHEGIQEMLECIDAYSVRINRIDIAIDGLNYLMPFMTGFYKNVLLGEQDNKGSVYLKNQNTTQFLPKGKIQSNGLFESFYIGSVHSDKFLKIYNKTLEMTSYNRNKSYIQKFWELNGLDTSGDIYRTEVTLKAKEITNIKKDVRNEYHEVYSVKKAKEEAFPDILFKDSTPEERDKAFDSFHLETKGLELTDLLDSQNLLALFKLKTRNLLDFRVRGTTKTKKADKKLQLIDYDKEELFLSAFLEEKQKKLSSGRYAAQLAIKNCVYMYSIGKFDAFHFKAASYLYDMVSYYGLENWFCNRLEYWSKEIDKLYNTNSKESIRSLLKMNIRDKEEASRNSLLTYLKLHNQQLTI